MDKLILNDIFDLSINWQMSFFERTSILYILNRMNKCDVAIEIGSYQGGLLKHLSKFFNKVYSCDISHDNVHNRELYKNVEWVKGDSKLTVPSLIENINESEEDIGFILIDGDHSYEAVLNDINAVLKYQPKSETIILIHDSWYAPSRQAINDADWNSNPHVHLVEKDFAVGDLMRDGNYYVGGLALVYISSDKRDGNVEIKQTYDYMYSKTSELLNR